MRSVISNHLGRISIALILGLISCLSAEASPMTKECASSSTSFSSYKSCIKEKYKLRGIEEAQALALSEKASNLDYCALRLQLPDGVPPSPSHSVYPIYQQCMGGGAVPDQETVAAATKPSSCRAACDAASKPENYSSGDPACDRDPACKACVQGKMGSQLGSYCTATNVTKKGKTNQAISAAIYTAVGAVCAPACFPPVGSFLEAACQVGGIVTLASELLLAKSTTQLDSYSKGWVQTTTSIAKPIVQTSSALNILNAVKGAKTAAGLVKNVAAKSNNKMACAASVIYFVQAGLKFASIGKFNKNESRNCDEVEKLIAPSKASPLIAECKVNSQDFPSNNFGYSAPSGVPKTFSIKDPEISKLIESDPKLKEFVGYIGKDPKIIEEFNKIGQKVLDDGGIEGVVADIGAAHPGAPVDGFMESFNRARDGDTLTALNMTGEETKIAMVSSEDGGYSNSADMGTSTLRFGSLSDSVTPQEGAEALAVGRAPAGENIGFKSRDPFDPNDQRDLFRKASDQLKNQCSKKNVLSLAPESRMNRMLSGARSGVNREAK